PGDTQRVLRALEVLEQTGKSLAEWQEMAPEPIYPQALFRPFFLNLPREAMYANAETRFDAMLVAGVIEEIRALDAMQLDPALPTMKAHGVPELLMHLHGEMSLEEASAQVKRNTRHYIKRQLTWFRHQMPDATGVEPGEVEKLVSDLQ